MSTCVCATAACSSAHVMCVAPAAFPATADRTQLSAKMPCRSSNRSRKVSNGLGVPGSNRTVGI